MDKLAIEIPPTQLTNEEKMIISIKISAVYLNVVDKHEFDVLKQKIKLYAKIHFYFNHGKLKMTPAFSAADIYNFPAFVNENAIIGNSYDYDDVFENENLEEILRNTLNTKEKDIPMLDATDTKKFYNTILHLTVYFVDEFIKDNQKYKHFKDIEKEIDNILSRKYKFSTSTPEKPYQSDPFGPIQEGDKIIPRTIEADLKKTKNYRLKERQTKKKKSHPKKSPLKLLETIAE